MIGNNFLIGQKSVGHLVRPLQVKEPFVTVLKRWEEKSEGDSGIAAIRDDFLSRCHVHCERHDSYCLRHRSNQVTVIGQMIDKPEVPPL